MQLVHHDQVLKRSWCKEESITFLQWHGRTELRLIIIIAQMRNLIQITVGKQMISSLKTNFHIFNCVNLLVSKIAGHKKESSLQNTHCCRWWYRIEIFELNFWNDIVIRFECDFKNIPLFSLYEEKVHRFGAMRCRAYKYHSTLWIVKVVAASWNWASNIMLVTKILVRQIVLRTNEYTGWTVVTAGHRNQKVCVLFEWLRVFPHNMVKPKIKLVEGQCLLSSLGSFTFKITKNKTTRKIIVTSERCWENVLRYKNI